MLINLDGNIKSFFSFCKFDIQDPFVHGPTDTFCFFSFLVHFDLFYTGESLRVKTKSTKEYFHQKLSTWWAWVEFSAVNCVLKYILHTVQGVHRIDWCVPLFTSDISIYFLLRWMKLTVRSIKRCLHVPDTGHCSDMTSTLFLFFWKVIIPLTNHWIRTLYRPTPIPEHREKACRPFLYKRKKADL